MHGIATLICYLLFGTLIVVGVGVCIQLKQQARAKKRQPQSSDRD